MRPGDTFFPPICDRCEVVFHDGRVRCVPASSLLPVTLISAGDNVGVQATTRGQYDLWVVLEYCPDTDRLIAASGGKVYRFVSLNLTGFLELFKHSESSYFI